MSLVTREVGRKISREIDVNYDDITQAIANLADHYHIKLSALLVNEDLYQDYKYIKEMTDFLFGSDEYNVIIKIILQQFRPSIIDNDTIGSFLFGCFQSNHGDVDAQCSPLCLNSIKNPFKSTKRCTEQIWIQSSYYGENRFISLTPRSSSIKAYVFVFDTFNGFTEKEVDGFSDSNILLVECITTKNSKHYQVFKFRTIDDLPMQDKSLVEFSDNLIIDLLDDEKSHSSSLNMGIGLLIMGLIVILSYFLKPKLR